MKSVISLVLLLAAMVLSTNAMAQAEGVWFNQEKTAHVEIYKNPQNSKLYGKIVWLKEPNDEKGNPKTDPENPNPALRKRSRLGMVMLTGFVADGKNYWTGGEIYNPKDGKTYSCNMTLQADGTLKLRGYMGISLIGKTQIWTRAK